MNMEQFMDKVENANSAVELMGIFGEVNSPMLSRINDDVEDMDDAGSEQ